MKSKKLSKLLKIQAVVFAVIIAAGVCSVGVFAYNCSRVRSDVLRMHVIANSDSDEDQALKLKVRDAVLECVALGTGYAIEHMDILENNGGIFKTREEITGFKD